MRFSSPALAPALLVAALCALAPSSSLAARTAVLQVSLIRFLCMERRELPLPSPPLRELALKQSVRGGDSAPKWSRRREGTTGCSGRSLWGLSTLKNRIPNNPQLASPPPGPRTRRFLRSNAGRMHFLCSGVALLQILVRFDKGIWRRRFHRGARPRREFEKSALALSLSLPTLTKASPSSLFLSLSTQFADRRGHHLFGIPRLPRLVRGRRRRVRPRLAAVGPAPGRRARDDVGLLW